MMLQDLVDHHKPGGAASPIVAATLHVTLDDIQQLTTSEDVDIQFNLSYYSS
jgi:hypothetical protein